MKTLFIFPLLCSVMQVGAQALQSVSIDAPTDLRSGIYNPDTHSPDLNKIVRYDDINISLSSGQIAPAIPLLRFDDPDFNFPIEAVYNANGFIPTETDGILGMHWSLNIGGVIHREINGIPDEAAGSIQTASGFMSVVGRNLNNETMKNNLLYGIENEVHKNLNMKWVQMHTNGRDQYYARIKEPDGTSIIEASSDIYHFRFGRHSGRFMINFDGSVNVVGDNGGHYRVDMIRFQPVTIQDQGNSEIVIITDDGFSYHFGGSYDAMEYTAFGWREKNNNSMFVDYMRNYNSVSAFYLTKIVATNGRTLTITYDASVDASYHKEPHKIAIESTGSHARTIYPYNYEVTASLDLPFDVNYDYTPLDECYSLKK